MLTSETTAGERFARALLAKDWNGVAAVLDPNVDFRGLTPGRAWEASTAGERILKLRVVCSGFLPAPSED